MKIRGLAGVILAAGILTFLYPIISNHLARQQQENVIVGYENVISQADKDTLQEEWEKAVLYNQDSGEYMDVLNLNNDGIMGYIEIPDIDVRIPIYHDATEKSLAKGIGHIRQTALPIGEKGGHPILAGHRGLPGKELFTRLDELKKGDCFFLHILDQVLVYRVCEVKVVRPEEVTEIKAEEGKDYVTLMTCTPYGVNTHRLLVRGERSYDVPIEEKHEVDNTRRNKIIIYLIILFTGIALLLYPKITDRMYNKSVQKQKTVFVKGAVRSKTKMEHLYQELGRMNEELYLSKQKNLTGESSYEKTTINLRMYGIKNNTIGYISIPRMKIELPILLGASEENMKKGAVHLTETSYPIGGENTNCVIAAHRGYSKTAMFRDIEKLQLGDRVYIRNFRNKLTYKVVEIRVIEPSDVGNILIQEGKDLVTLITCHPYRNNSQRYVVFCERM